MSHAREEAEGAFSLSTIRMRVVQDPVGTSHYIFGLHAEIERLRSALDALLVDIDVFGEPRRHKEAMSVGRVALGLSSERDQP